MLAASKRFALVFFTYLSIAQSVVVRPATYWVSHFVSNKSQIILFATVNVAITTASEYLTRTIYSKGPNDPNNFLGHDTLGHIKIHRQSFLNILMTLFASLLGGPLYFINKRSMRFAFFVVFAGVLSILSQTVGTLLRDGVVVFMLHRLIFDLAYSGTIKFFMFEFTRPLLLRFTQSIAGITSIRVSQDFLTTLVRVGILNWLGFK